MADDASLPTHTPMTNGTFTPDDHEEAGAPGSSPSLRDVCADFNSRVESFLNAPATDQNTKTTQEQTRISLDVIEEALQRYPYEQLSLSYNGGKDCLVLLILYLSVLHTHFTRPSSRRKHLDAATPLDLSSHDDFPTSIPSVYLKTPDPFPAVTEFVESSSARYHLSLTHLSTYYGPNPTKKEKSHSNPPLQEEETEHHDQSLEPESTTTKTGHGPSTTSNLPPTTGTSQSHPKGIETSQPIVTFRDAFAQYLALNPGVKAIFVGTRRTDPHGGHLTHFDATDHHWPAFMRVHPVIDWHLSEIWTFLRSPYLRYPTTVTATAAGAATTTSPSTGGELQYCSMYDLGYTSLGGVNDTLPNPNLRYVDEHGRERYRPAYEMTADLEERLGRE